MTCQFCSIPMVHVMSFSQNKRENFSRCPICKRETERKRDNSVNFGELLDKEIGGDNNEYKNR